MSAEAHGISRIGNSIRTARLARGWSLRAAAQRLGLSLRFLHELERGKTTARLDKVLQALAGLGMAFDIAPARGPHVREQVLERRQLLRRLAMAHGVRAMSLFGSGARGEAGPQSDLDFLVELDRGRTLLDLLSFKGDLETLFGRNVDVFTASTLKPRVLATARQDLVRVF